MGIHVNRDVLTCYYEMLSWPNNQALIKYALVHNLAKTKQEAMCALSGLQQWLACLKHRKPNVLPYVMFAGPVNDMYTVLIRNANIYQDFCERFMDDNFVHTNTVTDVEAARLVRLGCTDDTLCDINAAFGNELPHSLRTWFDRQGELIIVSESRMTGPEESFTESQQLRWKTAAPIGAQVAKK